jgi:hypothetical protein
VAASGAAFTCALTVLGLSATNSGLGYGGQGCPTLFVPAGQYYLATTTIDIAKTMRVVGEGNGQTGGPSTVLRWADATTGIRIQAYNTTGANGLVTGAPVTSARGDATIIEGLYLRGGYAGTESEAHGIHIRALCSIRDVYIDNFPGDGIYAYTTIGDPANGGNASSSKLTNITCAGNRNGMFFKGADANACVIIGADCRGNRQWGIWDSSFLGNFFYGCHTAGNGWDGAIGSKPTACTVAGHRYYVKPGQAAGAATNAPTGTTADNSWWGYGSEGGTYNGVVAWTSGTQFREGGAYKVDNANATAAFIGCYAEGDQNPSQVAAPAVMVGGNAVLGNAASGLSLRSDTGGAMQLGPTKGGRDGATYLETSGTAHLLQGRIWTGTSPVNIASLGFYNGFGTIHDVQNASWQHRFRVNGAGICNIGSGGLQVVSGSLGYGTGAGATVTQATSKSSAVTINKACGQIVTAADALAAGAVAEFSVANSQVAATDLVSVAIASGAAASSAYRCWVSAVAAGSFKVCIENRSAGSLAEALVLNFTVTKAVAA